MTTMLTATANRAAALFRDNPPSKTEATTRARRSVE
jgi:hypothetical protein